MTVPILPCISLDETLEFWEGLGFERTYYQNRPYRYGVVQRGGYELHFAGVPGLDPADSASGCLIMVADARQVHGTFAAALKARYGRVPTSGVPRISRMKPSATRFTVTDPSHNTVIIVGIGDEDQDTWEAPDQDGLTPFERKLAMARRFRDYKEDEEAAARTLDAALRRTAGAPAVDLAEALVARLELAESRSEPDVAASCRERLGVLRLSPEEMDRLKQRIEVPAEIEAGLVAPA